MGVNPKILAGLDKRDRLKEREQEITSQLFRQAMRIQEDEPRTTKEDLKERYKDDERLGAFQ